MQQVWKSSGLRWLGCLIHLLFLAPMIALGQADQGSLGGIVTDSSGAIVPNATVTVSNPDTGFTQTTTSDASGNYIFSPLKIGTYSVKAEAPGFASTTLENISVNVNSRSQANLTLGVGGATQTVTVTAAPPSLQTQDASTGQVMPTRVINDTPLNGRNFVFIAQLAAGVAPGNPGARGNAKGDFSANGQRVEQNNFILDGVDNNSNLVDFLNGASFVIKPPPDALQEFKVQTSNYSAELGRAAGAVLNVATKSGTNSFHGRLWEYFRNDVLNARDYFATSVPKYRQNQFGATLGGPFIRNRLFFFGDAEANRIVFGEHGIYSVPTALMRTGNFTELLNPSLTGKTFPILLYQPGGPTRVNGVIVADNFLTYNGQQNVIPPTNISAISQNILNLFPAPNMGPPGQTFNNYLFQGTGTDNTTQYDARVDWTIGSKDQAFARYSYSNQPVTIQAPLGILDGGGFGGSGSDVTEGRNFTFSQTHIFSPTFTNEFRVGYNWIHAFFHQPNIGVNLSPQLGLGGIPFSPGNGGLPYFNVTGLSTFGSAQYQPSDEAENVIQLLDNVTKVVGNHSIKFGINFSRIRVQTLQPIDARGTYNFSGKFTQDPSNTGNTGFGAADFLLDDIDSSSVANLFTSHNQRWYRSGYGQDDWKVSSKLTINIGVRYEYYQPIEELDGLQANFIPVFANGSGTYLLTARAQRHGAATLTPAFESALAANNIVVAYSNNPLLVNPAYGDVAPRLGLAYQIDQNTVFRAGFGMFYGGLESVGYYPNLAQNFPFQFDSNFQSSNFPCVAGNCPTNGQSLATGFSDALAVGLANFVTQPGLRSYEVNTQTPYSQQWNISFQRAFTSSTTATIAYVGSVNRHLQSNPDVNAVPQLLAPGSAIQSYRPFNRFGGSSLIDYAGNANYNALQATLERRFSRGLSFLAAYTYSSALDDAFLPLGGTGQSGSGYRNWRQLGYSFDYGPSFFDTRQRFTLNTQYELPVGSGKRYLNRTGFINQVAGGWALALLFRVQTGQPLIVLPNNDPTNLGNNNTAYAYRNGDPFATGGSPTSSNSACATRTRTVQTWINPCSFVNPPPAQVTGQSDLRPYGPPGRTTFFGPGYNRIDLSALKNFPVFRETYLQFRADIFNLFNTPAYGQPSSNLGSGFGQITSERFGGTGTAGESPDARVVQFALKYIF
jgi:Carboxypeptidase regulatory-like domain